MTSDDLTRLASYLYAAIEAGRATKADWQRWADRMIEAGATSDWIIDLSLARSKDQAVAQLARLGPFDVESVQVSYFDVQATLGHLGIRYCYFQLPFREFLREAARLSYDSYSGGFEFYDLVERLDAGSSEATIFAELAPRFAPLIDEAERQWSELFPENGGNYEADRPGSG